MMNIYEPNLVYALYVSLWLQLARECTDYVMSRTLIESQIQNSDARVFILHIILSFYVLLEMMLHECLEKELKIT